MNFKITITAIILLVLIFKNGAAQNNNLKFNLVKGINGKPLGKITAITQDPHGYMWFCGQGDKCIYRYDGNRIISFRQDSLNSNTLGMTNLETMYADDSGIIWIGGDGLDQYNPATGIFKHYKHIEHDPGSLVDNHVSTILKDRQGRLWVGTLRGLDRLNEKTGKFIHYRNEPGNPKSLSDNVVNTIYEDHRGVIWIGTGWRWFNYHPDDGGLNRLETDGTFTRYLHEPENEHSLINNKISSIFEDNRGTFWIGTSGDGLHTMDRKTGSFERHLYNPAKPDGLSRPPFPPGTENEIITFIREDSAGVIWIGSRSFGINRYDTGSKKITHYQNGNGFPDRSTWCAYTSRDGVLWIGTEEANLFRVDPVLKTINNITIGASARSFLDDKNGALWVGTGGNGLRQYDQKNKLIHQFNYVSSDLTGSGTPAIISLFQNQKDTIWLGTQPGGIITFNTNKKQFSRFRYDETFKDSGINWVTTIFQDKEGFKWFGSWAGLFRYNFKDGTVKQFLPDPKDPGSISNERISCALEDRNGDIWAGSFRNKGLDPAGLSRLNKQSGRFRHYLDGFIIDCIYEDSEGTIWTGTGKGLYQLKKGTDNFSPFFDPRSSFEGVYIKGIIEDDYKNLWISTQSAIIKLNPECNKTYIYDSKFGIAPNSPIGSIYKM